MLLTQILQPNCVVVPLKGRNKEEVINELVDVLDASGLVKDKADVLDSVLMREQTRSTGIGSGIAIPHGKSKGVNSLVMSIGIASNPVDFESIDGKPVTIVVLLASPTGQTGPHIQALASISRLMLDESLRKKMETAQSAEEVYDIISQKETE